MLTEPSSQAINSENNYLNSTSYQFNVAVSLPETVRKTLTVEQFETINRRVNSLLHSKENGLASTIRDAFNEVLRGIHTNLSAEVSDSRNTTRLTINHAY